MPNKIDKSNLVQVVAIWFDKKTKSIIVECEDGFIYQGHDNYNDNCFGNTDYIFEEVELVSNLASATSKNYTEFTCATCGSPLAKGNDYCGECYVLFR